MLLVNVTLALARNVDKRLWNVGLVNCVKIDYLMSRKMILWCDESALGNEGESVMVLTRKEVDEDISTDGKWVMVMKKEQLIVIHFALELE